jgi:hypothetical protein
LDDLILLCNHLVHCPDEVHLDFLFRQMWCPASSLVAELVVALINDPAVLVIGMPDLRTVPSSAFSTLDFGGKDAGTTKVLPCFISTFQFRLHHFKGLRFYLLSIFVW